MLQFFVRIAWLSCFCLLAANAHSVQKNHQKQPIALLREDGMPCVLLRTKAEINIIFKTDQGSIHSSTNLPDSPLTAGHCENANESSMVIFWGAYRLLFGFTKTPGRERWFLNKLELTVNTRELAHFPHQLSKIHPFLKVAHRSLLFFTPVGESFTCSKIVLNLKPCSNFRLHDSNVKLHDVKSCNEDFQGYQGLEFHGTLTLRNLQLQPFLRDDSGFGPPFECQEEVGLRKEQISIVAGSILAVAFLTAMISYGVFMYIKSRSFGVRLEK